MGGPHGNEFWVFSNSEMNGRNSIKYRWKHGIICLVPIFPSWVIVLKLSKKSTFFCNFVLTVARNLKSVGAIYIYASERSCCALWENGNCLLYTMACCFWDIRVWNTRIFDILIASILFFQTPINNKYHFLKEHHENFQMRYLTCFNRLRFRAEVSTKFQKYLTIWLP